MLDVHRAAEFHHTETRAPIPVLRPAYRAGVRKMNSFDSALPRDVRMSEGNDVSIPCTGSFRHLQTKCIVPVRCPVQRVEGRRPMHEDQARPTRMTAIRPHIDPERQTAQKRLSLTTDMRARP